MGEWNESMKKNGYRVPPVLDTTRDECYLCGYGGDLAVHEVYYGTKNRDMSKRKGAYVYVCPRCHRHIHEGGKLDRQLKKECQDAIIEKLDAEGHNGKEIFYAWFRRWYD